ncbi:hypothetical protein QOZ80_2AG0105930 [Eleusine coracana subsp. coracana]|nr:hypothetical protein QOZ80_2AG0105930 [Eleusine coracana subsp. coracana]
MGANCFAQTNALFRKNLVIQRRDCKTNCCLVCFPFLVCLLLGVGQIALTVFYLRSVGAANGTGIDCGYCNASTDASFIKDTLGGLDCTTRCPLPFAPKCPPVVQLPGNSELGMGDGLSQSQSTNLQGSSITAETNSKATFLATGSTQSFAKSVMSNVFPKLDSPNITADMSTLSDFTLGTKAMHLASLGADELGSDLYGHLYFLQDSCAANSKLSFPVQEGSSNFINDAQCTEGLFLWHKNLSVMNKELYRGYKENNETNKIVSAYDFTSSDLNKFNLIVSYNPTYKGPDHVPLLLIPLPPILLRVPRLLNLVSNAYLQLKSNDTKMRLEFVKDMPRPAQPVMPPDVSSELGKLPFVWIIMLLFPVILSNLVYEKQQKLRAMMKMHGLGDMSYWTITYCYFLILSLLYVLFLVIFGSVVDLKLFRLNDYRVQFVVYFAYINLQISFAFLVATYFSDVRIATVTGYLFTIGSGLLGEFMFRPVFEDISLSGSWITLMEFFPPFSLYRIIYEFSPPPAFMYRTDFSGIQWRDFSDRKNGMIDMLFIMLVAHALVGVIELLKGRPCIFKKPQLKWAGQMFSERERELNKSCKNQICLGILGPNGAGKTTLIGMLTGFMKPTSGTAYIDRMDIRLDMDKIYSGIGVCPQFDLLWETLTGREHLIFYGRLKNLSGATLAEAVEESLKSVRLFDGGVADKHVAKYSGGMKRCLSVAISLIGHPKVVYMDEPSSGLDPASRKALWNAVKSAKRDRAIMLTTHSMEEAEALCDRIAIIANGSLQCIGDSKELKARYGGMYVLTVTAAEGEEESVERLARSISPVVNRTYRISGTQKFEMPKQGMRISEVFEAMEHAKRRLNIHAWGLSDVTLEDVFVKVAEDSDISDV